MTAPLVGAALACALTLAGPAAAKERTLTFTAPYSASFVNGDATDSASSASCNAEAPTGRIVGSVVAGRAAPALHTGTAASCWFGVEEPVSLSAHRVRTQGARVTATFAVDQASVSMPPGTDGGVWLWPCVSIGRDFFCDEGPEQGFTFTTIVPSTGFTESVSGATWTVSASTTQPVDTVRAYFILVAANESALAGGVSAEVDATVSSIEVR